MTTPTPNRRWYHLTPDRFFIGLLVVQFFLLLSERFQWFWFNERKGWTVLIAVGVVCVAVVVVLIWGLVGLVLRRRFQFSFRSLLVFLVVVSMPLGWFAWELDKARRQIKGAQEMWESGAVVYYDYQIDDNLALLDKGEPPAPTWLQPLLGVAFFSDVVGVDSQSASFDDDDLGNVRQFSNVRYLSLHCHQVTDAGMEHLNGLTSLKCLHLWDGQVTDAGLAHLKYLPRLRDLTLHCTNISDDGLKHLKGLSHLEDLDLADTLVSGIGLEELKGLTNLKYLDLSRTRINDGGLKHLVGMTGLRSLDLGDTQTSDAGLQHLRGLNKLETLSLYRTEITDAGLDVLAGLPNLDYVSICQTQVSQDSVERLRQALPDCQIDY